MSGLRSLSANNSKMQDHSSARSITIRRLDLQFDGDQVTHGSTKEQADQVIDLINGLLQSRVPARLNAQLIAHPDEIEVESETTPGS